MADEQELFLRELLQDAIEENGEMSSEAQEARDELSAFYNQNGNYELATPYLKQSLEYYRLINNEKQYLNTLYPLGRSLRLQGEFQASITYLSQILELQRDQSQVYNAKKLLSIINLAHSYTRVSQYDKAKVLLTEILDAYKKGQYDFPVSYGWAHMRMGILFSKLGDLTQAEQHLDAAHGIFLRETGEYSRSTQITRLSLGKLYRKQGELAQSETILQSSVSGLVRLYGADNVAVTEAMTALGNTMIAQGRASEGRRLLERVVDTRKKVLGNKSRKTIESILALVNAIPGRNKLRQQYLHQVIDQLETDEDKNYKLLAHAYHLMGESQMLNADYELAGANISKSIENYKKMHGYREFLLSAPYQLMGRLALEQGKYHEAVEWLNKTVVTLEKEKGASDPAIARAYHDLAFALQHDGDTSAAIKQYRNAMSAMQTYLSLMRSFSEFAQDEQNVLAADLYNNYLSLMVRMYEKKVNVEVNPVEDSFLIAENSRSRKLQTALLSMSTRAAAKFKGLASLVHEEQDLRNELVTIDADLSNSISVVSKEDLPVVYNNLLQRRKARAVEIGEIRQRIAGGFPEYSNLMQPNPARIADVQDKLDPGEVMVSFYLSEAYALAWFISADECHLRLIPGNEQQISNSISRLRLALDIQATSLSDIPEYNTRLAHKLYLQLFGEHNPLIDKAKSLIVVPHGSLFSLPFGALVTNISLNGGDQSSKSLFSEYRRTQFLVRDKALSIIPSATAFVSIRKLQKIHPVRARPFIGFGNPVLNHRANDTDEQYKSRGFNITRRGASATNEISQLPELPETETELIQIARLLGADQEEDLFLRYRATEHNVKSSSLNRYRFIAFATHGLLANELKGLEEPALVLSIQKQRSADNDGLLKMSEVLELNMNPDLVVLSACNTAGSDGKVNGDGLTGLARSFIYAGAPSLLVTFWSVETTSAMQLTTALFSYLAESGDSGKAQALRKAKLHLIQGKGYMRNGKEIFSYAHPVFWAAFVLVGEGGG
jgi:CHAT domain-containing protein